MAEATAEAHTASVADSKPESNGAGAASSGDVERINGDDEKVSNGEAKNVHDEDNPERYDSRDKRDNRRDNDRRGGRDGGRGRGRGRGNARGRGRGGFGNGHRGNRGGNDYHKKDGVRTDFDRREESSDQTEIRRQVEFYFSDSNLPIDKFLLEETGGPENKPFPLKTLHTFKRMRHFQPFSAVVEAVKGSNVLEVNDQDEVFRKQPLDSKFTNDVKRNAELLTSVSMARSIYAKGFGEETRTSVFDIEEFFAPYGTRGVRLRRQEDGTFKGSVFVEFVDSDSAQQFLEMDDKPKFNDQELEVMSKQAYVEGKNQAILEGTVKPRSPTRYQGRNNGNRERRGSFQNKRKRGNDDEGSDGDKDNWRSRRDKYQRGGGRDGRDRKESRSRSPYRAPKKDENSEAKNDDAKIEESTETKKEDVKVEDVKTDAKIEESSAAATETRENAEETSA